MDSKEYLTNKKFCPIPWTGFMYNSNGDVLNCIRSQSPIGNLKDHSISNILKTNTKTKQNMTFNFNWKINLAFARKYRFLWIEKPLFTFLGSVFYQTLIVASSYFIFYIFFSILLKEELMLSDTFILILYTLMTIYLIISILNIKKKNMIP